MGTKSGTCSSHFICSGTCFGSGSKNRFNDCTRLFKSKGTTTATLLLLLSLVVVLLVMEGMLFLLPKEEDDDDVVVVVDAVDVERDEMECVGGV